MALVERCKERAWTERWILGPSLVIFAAVLVGTLLPGVHGDKDKTLHIRFIPGTNETDFNHSCHKWPHEATLLMIDDLVVRKLGFFLTIPIVLPYLWALRRLPRDGQQYQDCKLLVFVFVLIHIIRAAIYFLVMPTGVNEVFSDHVFLVCSLVAAIQITQGVLSYGVQEGDCPCHGRFRWAERPYSVLLLFLFFVEVISTSKTYHTVFASWFAYVVGTILFTGTAFWATRRVGGARWGDGGGDHMPYARLEENTLDGGGDHLPYARLEGHRRTG